MSKRKVLIESLSSNLYSFLKQTNKKGSSQEFVHELTRKIADDYTAKKIQKDHQTHLMISISFNV